MGVRNRFDDAAYAVTSNLFDSREPLIAKRGMGIYAPRNRQPRKDTPEFFHSVPKLAWFLGVKFPYAILPFNKLKMKCQCGPCTFPWYQAGRKIPVKDCEVDPPCRACRDTMKMMDWAAVIVEWFLMHETDRDIEEEHRWKPGTVNQIVQKIHRQIRGDRQDGLPRTGNPRGRPKRKIELLGSSDEMVILLRGKALSTKKRIPDSPQAYYERDTTVIGSSTLPSAIVHTIPVPTPKF